MSTILIKQYTSNKYYIGKGYSEKVGYINLNGIIDILRKGKSIKVINNETGEDITNRTLIDCLRYVEVETEVLLKLIKGNDNE